MKKKDPIPLDAIIAGFSEPGKTEKIKEEGFSGYLISVKDNQEDEIHLANLSLVDAERRLCLHRVHLFWMEPDLSAPSSPVPADSQFILWERSDKNFGLLLPLIDTDMRTTAEPDGENFKLLSKGTVEGKPQSDVLLALTCVGSDPYEMIKNAIDFLAERLKTFRSREKKQIPGFMDWLGWCTWNAFYHEVDSGKVLAGLDSFLSTGFQPGFVILDDGWMQTDGTDYFEDFPPDPEKFPEGFLKLISQLKKKYGVKYFGIWHALTGYWGGLSPGGPLHHRFRTVQNKGNIRPCEKNPEPIDLFLVHPKDIHRFYDEFYSFLCTQGIDFVKVDGQSSVEVFTQGKLGRVRSMTATQHAMQGSAAIQFDSGVLNCMSHGSDVFWNMLDVNVMRNSNDYFPDQPDAGQQKHIIQNSYNNILFSHLCFPDWDMFQSGNSHSEFHAASRAISGGPVYISDIPGKQNNKILAKLCLSNGRVLRCPQPALPSPECLLTDCQNGDEKFLKLFNSNHCKATRWGMLGIFHCHSKKGEIGGSFSLKDVPGLQENEFACWSHFGKTLSKLGPDDRMQITLRPVEAEIITLAPIVKGFAALGLLDKYNSSAAVIDFSVGDGCADVTFSDGGLAGFFSERIPVKTLMNGTKKEFSYQPDSKLLTMELPEGRAVTVKIYFEGTIEIPHELK